MIPVFERTGEEHALKRETCDAIPEIIAETVRDALDGAPEAPELASGCSFRIGGYVGQPEPSTFHSFLNTWPDVSLASARNVLAPFET